MVLFVILKIGDSMKKILLIILLLIPFIFMDKVYANTNDIYDYKVNVDFDVDNEMLMIHEEFHTNDKFVSYRLHKTFYSQPEGLETNIYSFEYKENNTYYFALGRNKEYYIDYRLKCKPTNCKYVYSPIEDEYADTYANIDIMIKEINNETLPKYKITKSTSLGYSNNDKTINVYKNGNISGIEFELLFTDELDEEEIEEIEKQADVYFSFVLGFPAILAGILCGIFALLKGKYKASGFDKNNNTLREWRQRDGDNESLDIKQAIILVSAIMVSTIICCTVFYILATNLLPSVSPQLNSLFTYFGIEFLVTAVAYPFPLIVYMDYKEAKLTSDIAKGELRFCDHYDFECKKKGLKYIYKIDVHENINNEVKTYTSGYKKAKEEPRGPVFLLYINDKNYYVDYLKK